MTVDGVRLLVTGKLLSPAKADEQGRRVNLN
jgi:hypothetical protein